MESIRVLAVLFTVVGSTGTALLELLLHILGLQFGTIVGEILV